MTGSPHPITEFKRFVQVDVDGNPTVGAGGSSVSSDQLPAALGPQLSAVSLSVTDASDSASVVALNALATGFGATDDTKVTDADTTATLLARMAGISQLIEDIKVADAAAYAGTDPVPVVTPSDLIVKSLTVDTSALADGDVMAVTQELAGALRLNGGRTWLQSIVAIDTDDQGVKFDLFIFNANTSIGTLNSVPDIDDTEALTLLGYVRGIGETDATLPSYSPFIDLGGCRVAQRTNIGLLLEASATSVWIAAVTRGAPTYASGIITLKIGVSQD